MNTEEYSRYRLLIIIFGSALGLCVGFAPVYFGTLSIFLKPIALEFGWGRAQTSGAGVLSMLGLALGAVVVGRSIDRFGPARTITSAVFLTAALMAVLPQVGNHPALFTALSFVIGFAGAGTTPPGYLSVLTRWFDKRLGLALGIAGIGMGVGTILMPMAANWLIAAQGWRAAYLSLAGLSGVLGGVACLVLFCGASSPQPSRSGAADALEELQGLGVAEALRTRHLWLLLAMVTAVAVASLGISIHFVSMLTDKSVSATMAAQAAAISGAGVVIGRVACGYLLDRCHAPIVAAGAFLSAAAGALVLAMGVDLPFSVVALSGLFIGLSLGAEGDFLPYFVRRYFGLKAFGSVYGVLFLAHGVGGVVGPVLFGLAFDRLGSYAPALWGACLALCAAAALVTFMGKYRFPD